MLLDPSVWASFFALVVLELVLGIDNVVFIAVVASRLPPAQQRWARNFGISLALFLRVALLASIAWLVGLTEPVLTLGGFALSWRDLVMLGGGLFLLFKASQEIHDEVLRGHKPRASKGGSAAFAAVVGQIAVIDMVFSIDSVIVAVALAEHLAVMVAAVLVAVIVMLVTAGPVSRFIAANPSTRMLALSFLLVIGAALMADGLHIHFDREPIYAAMGFAAFVEFLNLVRQRRRARKGLGGPLTEKAPAEEGQASGG